MWRRKAKSSIPNSVTGSAGSTGNRMMSRKSVIREVGRPSREANRAPSLPHVASPIASSARPRLAVIRAHGATKGIRRSLKILRAQVG